MKSSIINDDFRLIATSRPGSQKQLALLRSIGPIFCLWGLAICIASEGLASLKQHWAANSMLLLAVCLAVPSLWKLRKLTASTLCANGEALFYIRGSRRQNVIKLKDIHEILIGHFQASPWKDLRVPAGQRRIFESIVLLTKPFEDLRPITQRALLRSPSVFSFAVRTIPISRFNEPALEIGRAIVDAVSKARGAAVPFREILTDGPEHIRPDRTDLSSTAYPADLQQTSHTLPPGTKCIMCGYDLRQIAADALCPECGTPAERSLMGHVLAAADHSWLKTVAANAYRLGFYCLLALLAIFVAFISVLMQKTRPGPAARFLGLPLAMVLVTAAISSAVFYLPILWAGWHFTTPEPLRAGSPFDPRSRRIARILLFAPVLGSVVCASLVSLRLTLLALIFVILSSIGVLLMYAARLLYRVPEKRWAFFSLIAGTIMTYAGIVGVGVFVVIFAGRIITALPGLPPPPSPRGPPTGLDLFQRYLLITLAWLGPLYVIGAVCGAYWNLASAIDAIVTPPAQDDTRIPSTLNS